MKSENILLEIINKGYIDQQVIYSILQEILGIDNNTMLDKIQSLREQFINDWKEKFMED